MSSAVQQLQGIKRTDLQSPAPRETRGATGDPSSAALSWPSLDDGVQVMSFVSPPQPQVDTEFASRHHCAFWAVGADAQDQKNTDNNPRR